MSRTPAANASSARSDHRRRLYLVGIGPSCAEGTRIMRLHEGDRAGSRTEGSSARGLRSQTAQEQGEIAPARLPEIHLRGPPNPVDEVNRLLDDLQTRGGRVEKDLRKKGET